MVWWFGGLVVWWFGGLVVSWFGGLVFFGCFFEGCPIYPLANGARWFGGLVVSWFFRRGFPCTRRGSNPQTTN